MDKLNLGKKLANYKANKPRLMRLIANNAVNFFKVTNFEAEGFVDNGVKKWKPRKDKDTGRRLLVKTGRGRQSIHTQLISAEKVVIVADAPYMKYHNDGTKKLPQRKFMGNSRTLDRQNIKIVESFIKL